MQRGLCPLHRDGDSHLTLLARPDAHAADISELEWATMHTFRVEHTSADIVERSIERFRRLTEHGDINAEAVPTDEPLDADARDLAAQPPVIRFLNLLVRDAVAMQASDIHLEARRSAMQTRFRLDGVLIEGPDAPAGLHFAVVSRCKLLAGLDIAERRRPQDGRIRMRLDERELDLRISTVPTLHGESVVIRLLEQGDRPLELSALGIPVPQLATVIDAVEKPHGLVLVTGPTGSGKTTTLYAALAHRNGGTEKLITIEDPVEYQVPNVTQVPVHHGSGVSFASALRAILRQDPDVVLVGELRDAETASVAVQAAMTGHLVLATLHTNDALSAFPRLIDLGVPAYLLIDMVSIVAAQRLVRRVCAKCRERRALDETDRAWLTSLGVDCNGVDQTVGVGCTACRGTGYRGRVGIFEVVAVTPALRGALLAGAGRDELARVACESDGFQSLLLDGARKAIAGQTTFAEVRRVACA
jgi:general secretion pathway protein E